MTIMIYVSCNRGERKKISLELLSMKFQLSYCFLFFEKFIDLHLQFYSKYQILNSFQQDH